MENLGQFVKQLSKLFYSNEKQETNNRCLFFRPQSKDDLNRIIPKNVKHFQLFVSDDILLYSLVNIQ